MPQIEIILGIPLIGYLDGWMKIHIKKGNKQYGPYPEAQVKMLLEQRTVSASDSACIEGTSQWITVEEALNSSSPVQEAPSTPSPIPQPLSPNYVIVKGFDMPFEQLVNFLIKFWFASLLAGVVVAIPVFLLYALAAS